MNIIRESPTGQLIRLISPSSLPYPEETPGFSEKAASTNGHHHLLEHCLNNNHNDGTVEDADESRTILCTWRGESDPDNPLNWRKAKKLLVVVTVATCSFVVYMTAPIWTPGQEAFAEEFGTNHAYSSLGLALFV